MSTDLRMDQAIGTLGEIVPLNLTDKDIRFVYRDRNWLRYFFMCAIKGHKWEYETTDYYHDSSYDHIYRCKICRAAGTST
jgi:hypothetical protein